MFITCFLATRSRIGSEKKIFVSSLRRHYPDQVQRVDGDEAILSAGSYPSSPSKNAILNRLFKNWPIMRKLHSHSVSLKKYRGQLGHPPSCGLGLKSASSCIPIFRSSSLAVRMMLGILTPSGISTIPTAYGVMCLNWGGETWTIV